MTTESARVGPGLIRGQMWATNLAKNQEALKRVLSKDTMDGVKEFTETVRMFRAATTRAGNASETASAMISQSEMSTLLNIGVGGTAGLVLLNDQDIGGAGKAATIVLAPRLIAKILANGGGRVLAQGMKVQRGTPAAAKIAGRIAAYAAQPDEEPQP